ncbi:hypothetical protein AAWM_06168 [Aspergillus awamori]|uniref:Uncharacterized protein n=2 Tax=Aspergillus TaxID=5052 RepID=A0A3F3PVF3_9EURO|nr:hypothetical protein BDQ94DRAFT_172670 [Aspergillus welwitschiae]GCB23283.1 hypothetical protein AAWM_06168 [Aspergillus awamori]GKZ64106.1 hypothetical protein AnigIFM50267_003565 [Aspergillus niger]RDH30903.1 hypothetical protein BDQ94DRAFT_172670 [Aspergillus welwitschiae]GLA14396.1 hypothetical protein AnigIFM62618_000775 [Aspergillus niger]GLA41985.1 hypothetical protein AnigIFM63309_010311 [Aspergillus niger]
MRLASASVLAMLPATGLAACGTAYSGNQINGTLLRTVVLDMGSDAANVTATQYDQYFKQGSALEGVKSVIAASEFYINLWAIPGTESAFQSVSQCLSDGYLVNQVAWLYYNTTTASWWGGYEAETEADSYNAAALSVVTNLVAGLEVRFWDTNGDGYTDVIDADYLEGVGVDTVTQNANGTYSVYRGNIDIADKTSSEGTIFDADLFSGSGPTIAAENFDTSIASGDVALFWYGPKGWAMKRAQEVAGLFVGGADHTSYNIDGVVYEDAMRFSRDNLFISNRPGEFTDAQKFFKFTNDSAAGLNVSLWLVPVTNTSEHGAPVGMTSDGNSRSFLARAIAQAQAQLANVTISSDGSNVPSTREWVTQANYTQLDDAIARANLSLALANSSSFLLDYQTYLLYLTLNGSSTDIGAAFAGFSYTGFENEEQLGTA